MMLKHNTTKSQNQLLDDSQKPEQGFSGCTVASSNPYAVLCSKQNRQDPVGKSHMWRNTRNMLKYDVIYGADWT